LIPPYATNTSEWEEWQQEYRFGVLLIFPPEPVLTQVNMLRAVYDPRSHATCDAHISLTIPLPRPMREVLWNELLQLTADIPPFSIQYGPLRDYLPHPGVCLTIEPQAMLCDLVHLLETASVFAGARPRRYPFSAHMTIAEFISADQTVRLIDELAEVAPRGSFLCGGLAYVVPNAQFRFAERRELSFGRNR